MTETIIVFGFLSRDGTEDDFVTLIESIARKCEHRETRILSKPYSDEEEASLEGGD